MCRVTFVLALFHVLLSYAVCGPGYVVELTNKNFEHQTQAATGQTTGRWYVFFFEPGRGACIRLLKQWETLAIHNEMDDVIFAKVDIQRSPELKERFKIEQTPHVVLFRDRAMYTYKGPVIGNQADKYLQSFYREGYEKMVILLFITQYRSGSANEYTNNNKKCRGVKVAPIYLIIQLLIIL
eukprot:TRINITY_DN9712_c0_g1_i1.p1 TRINITY_DN9712_c0_g1~~TRINITY_DN9712_c0_g1_i1.p1  ORF type:complete len:182 (-),score=15.44 TRINITY_DN9712_c0_g1_i1:130-675(-)